MLQLALAIDATNPAPPTPTAGRALRSCCLTNPVSLSFCSWCLWSDELKVIGKKELRSLRPRSYVCQSDKAQLQTLFPPCPYCDCGSPGASFETFSLISSAAFCSHLCLLNLQVVSTNKGEYHDRPELASILRICFRCRCNPGDAEDRREAEGSHRTRTGALRRPLVCERKHKYHSLAGLNGRKFAILNTNTVRGGVLMHSKCGQRVDIAYTVEKTQKRTRNKRR
jgi:hypothetical protein